MTLDDRLAVVTGAGSGIGRGIALALSAQGARIAAVDLSRERADETVDLIASAGGTARAYHAGGRGEDWMASKPPGGGGARAGRGVA